VPGPLVDEIDVEPLDFGDELIKSVDPDEYFAYSVPPAGHNVLGWSWWISFRLGSSL
jgi:hypothetical protein